MACYFLILKAMYKVTRQVAQTHLCSNFLHNSLECMKHSCMNLQVNKAYLKKKAICHASMKTWVQIPGASLKPDTAVCIFNPSAPTRDGKWRRENATQVLDPASVAQTATNNKDPVSNKVESKDWHTRLSSNHHTCVPTHTRTIHTHIKFL